jgi:hypothetical protein
MYATALWFWSGVFFGAAALGLVAAGLRSTEQFAARLLGIGARARHSLTEHFDSFLPSSPSHPSTPGVH